jgi:hypothetical protein
MLSKVIATRSDSLLVILTVSIDGCACSADHLSLKAQLARRGPLPEKFVQKLWIAPLLTG